MRTILNMRIGLILDVYKPHISGVTLYVANTKLALEAMGHQVHIFSFGNQEEELDEENVHRSTGIKLGGTGYFAGLRYRSEMVRTLKTMDIVHVQHPFVSGRLALRYCRPEGIPIVYTNHTRYDLYAKLYFPSLPSTLSEILLRRYMPSFASNVDRVVAPSKGLAVVLREWGVGVPVRVIPNGVNLEPFQAPIVPIDRAQWNLGSDRVLLTYMGRIGPEKNLDFLITAFKRAFSKAPELALILIGGGSELASLKDQVRSLGIEEAVHFTGMIDYDQLPRYLQAADAFVTPSISEVHPLSLIEALAVGLPAIGIYSPGIEDTIVDGENGFLSSEDLDEFAARMITIGQDPSIRKRMGEGAKLSSSQYDIRQTTAKIEGLYRELVDD